MSSLIKITSSSDAYIARLLSELKETLFFAKFLDEFDNFLNPGASYDIIAARSSHQSHLKNKEIFIYENDINRRDFSTSKFFKEDIFNYDEIYRKIKEKKNIWTYQPYPWTDELPFLGINIIANSYNTYLIFDNKITMHNLILNHGSPLLKEIISNKMERLLTEYITINDFPSPALDNIEKIYSAARSDGGSGVFYAKPKMRPKDVFKPGAGPVFRAEKYLEDFIPLTQTSFVFKKETIKYKPGIQLIIKSPAGSMSYFGTDYTTDQHVDDSILRKVSTISHDVCKLARSFGYRGSLGCDYLVNIKSEEIFLIEINPRFQASSFLFSNTKLNSDNSINVMRFLTNPYVLQLSSFKEDAPHSLLYKFCQPEHYIDSCNKNKSLMRLKKGYKYRHTSNLVDDLCPREGLEVEEGAPYTTLLIGEGILRKATMPQILKGALSWPE
jgi:hypothetical protein